MASMAGITIYNFPPQAPNWDAVGKFYICFAVIWSCLVVGGMAFLIVNRQNPIVRVRGIVLPLTAIAFLHAYWILAQVVYPIGLTMSLPLAYSIQYFFMGIWFPLGIAVFHVFNLRFLQVAEMQKQFTDVGHRRQSSTPTRQNTKRSKFFKFSRITDHDFESHTLIIIGVCMVIQVLLTVGMWLACSKYHPTFGAPGTQIKGDNFVEQLVDLGRGWEWWPSVLWQVVWTWIVAPVLLFRAWGIRDTIGWRVQTIGCCISNLHATPMFLIASYVPAFAPINAYYAPSQWIHLSIMMFEIFTIFVPCFQVLRQRILLKTISSNEKQASSVLRQSVSQQSLRSTRPGKNSYDSSSDNMSMHSLENALQENPAELQDFSALREFSGENIAYLRDVQTWKKTWPGSEPSSEQLRMLFYNALDIYTELISVKDANFPVNISAPERRFLASVFEKAARAVHGEVDTNAVSPFEMEVKKPVKTSEIELQRVGTRVIDDSDIPGEFTRAVFDRAYDEIKYLVFTNTWPKFILERQKSRSSVDSGSSRGS